MLVPSSRCWGLDESQFVAKVNQLVSQTISIAILAFLALLAANLPFLTSRLFGVLPFAGSKTLGVRLLELVAYYFLIGGVGLLLEKRAGQIAPQTWEFYANTATLFITLAFPGFVDRYLVKRHGGE